jgi:ankyrin repeat protein
MQHTSSTDESASLTRNSSRSSSSSSKGSIIKATLCRSTCLTIDPGAEHKCSMECIDKYPIHHAARQGSFRRLKLLLEDPACSKCPLGPDECLGRTPLHYAVSTGNVEKGLVCTKMLLECRQLTEHANAAEKIKGYVNHLDKCGKTALHLAAKNEATQIVIELLTNQAEFDISSNDGSCALREIYKNTPIAMEEALNQSISYLEKCSRPTLPSDNVSVKNNEFDFTRTCVNVCLDF